MANKSPSAAVALYLSGVGLESLLDDLGCVGSKREDVCVVLPQTHSVSQTLHSLRSGTCSLDAAPEIESVIEWLSQFGAVIIPGVGMFVAGREFVGTLFGTANQSKAYGNAVRDLGLPPAYVQHYEDWIRGGGVMVYVCCNGDGGIHPVAEVLEEAGAEEVLWLGNTSERSPALAKVS